jgi:hypothetical protein
LLNFPLRIVQPPLDYFRGLGPTLLQPLLQSTDARSIDKDEIAVDFVIMNLLPALHINVQQTNLCDPYFTLPRFITSINFPL